MDLKEELSCIKKEIIPWIQHWDRIMENDKPEELSEDIYRKLLKFVTEHPDYEDGLRELLTVELLLGNRLAAVRLLKRIINLPRKKSPKMVAKDKAQLKNLIKKPDEECDSLLGVIKLTRQQFLELGKYVEEQSDRNQEINLKEFPLTEFWARKVLNVSDEGWYKLQSRLLTAGIFSDYDLREAFFEMTPHL